MGITISEGPSHEYRDAELHNAAQQAKRRAQMRKDEKALKIPATFLIGAGLMPVAYGAIKLAAICLPYAVDPIKDKIIDRYNEGVDDKIRYVLKQRNKAKSDTFEIPSQDTYKTIGRSDEIHIPEITSYSAVIAAEALKKPKFKTHMDLGAIGIEAGMALGFGLTLAYKLLDVALKHKVPQKISTFVVETFKLYDENKNHFKDNTNGTSSNHFKDYSRPVKPELRARKAAELQNNNQM